MKTRVLLRKIYEILVADPPPGVRKVFEPGKPATFRQNMPAVLIQPDTPTKETEYVAGDVKDTLLSCEVHVLTDGGYERMESRSHGSMDEAIEICEEIEETLEANPTLDDLVDDLESLKVHHFSPAHSWVRLTYRIRERR